MLTRTIKFLQVDNFEMQALLVYLLADSPLSCLVSPSLFRRTHCWFRPIMLRLEVTLSQAWLVSSSPPDGPEEITAAALTGEGLTARPPHQREGSSQGGGERRVSMGGRGVEERRGFWNRGRGVLQTGRDERWLKRARWRVVLWSLLY